ncbi:hypothetical protein BHE74_00030191 [Ensete ventricosum]|nr:hypothetical protein BHE74_00030191 [Ensete ventricosum]
MGRKAARPRSTPRPPPPPPPPPEASSPCCHVAAECAVGACGLCVCCPLMLLWCCVKLPFVAAWRTGRGTYRLCHRCCRGGRRGHVVSSSFSDNDFDVAAIDGSRRPSELSLEQEGGSFGRRPSFPLL